MEEYVLRRENGVFTVNSKPRRAKLISDHCQVTILNCFVLVLHSTIFFENSAQSESDTTLMTAGREHAPGRGLQSSKMDG